MKEIYSYTMKNVLDARDGGFIHHDQHVSELDEPEIKYCYANTIVIEVKSSHYNDPDEKGYGLKYKVFILLEDFYTIAKDKDIEFSEAVEYALKYGDVHIRCTCPAFLYFGYAYIGTQLRYLYGLPRENRSPKVRNPSMKGTVCKHADKAITYCLQHMDLIKKMFEVYYNRFETGDKLIAIDDTGKSVTVGTKNGNGDVFFEKQLEEYNEYKKQKTERESKLRDEMTEEEQEEHDMNPDEWYYEDDLQDVDDNVIEENSESED